LASDRHGGLFARVPGAVAGRFLVTWLWGGNKTQLDLLVESSIPARLATAFVAVFTAPLVEELIYRGVLYSAVERALGRAVAIGAVGCCSRVFTSTSTAIIFGDYRESRC
jgi:membrane protease YdiL (CAAX protease family)